MLTNKVFFSCTSALWVCDTHMATNACTRHILEMQGTSIIVTLRAPAQLNLLHWHCCLNAKNLLKWCVKMLSFAISILVGGGYSRYIFFCFLRSDSLMMFVDVRLYGLIKNALKHSSFPWHIDHMQNPTGVLHGTPFCPCVQSIYVYEGQF